ncbi:hypothetical protein DIPPA_26860 [Diplonema papillatum]|nr:hypothetical protein DIPPA_26860 [Diplonema papillatum]|eukprot:gene10526-16184_t
MAKSKHSKEPQLLGIDRDSLVLAFAAGLFVFSCLVSESYLDGYRGTFRSANSAQSLVLPIGAKVVVESDSAWVHVLVSAYPHLAWDSNMETLCGTAGDVVALDFEAGLVKLRHTNGMLMAWPIEATNIKPKRPPAEFVLTGRRRATYYVDRLEAELSKKTGRLAFVLRTLSMGEWEPRLIEEGLVSLQNVVSATDADREALGVHIVDWSKLQLEARRVLNLGENAPTAFIANPPVANLKAASAPPPSAIRAKTALAAQAASKKKAKHFASMRLIHVPKAGGTAFTSALRSILGCSVEPCLGDPSEHEACDALQGCYGHEPLLPAHVESKKNGTLDFLAVNVREPVARIVSAFHHGRREWPCCGLPIRAEFRDRLYNAKGKPNAFTLTTFAEAQPTRNCMTKMLAGLECKADVAITEHHYSKAVERLQLFDAVFILEHVQASLDLMACVTGHPLTQPALQQKVRAGTYTDMGTPRERQAITKANEWDALLYAASKRRFCDLHAGHRCEFEPPSGLCTEESS